MPDRSSMADANNIAWAIDSALAEFMKDHRRELYAAMALAGMYAAEVTAPFNSMGDQARAAVAAADALIAELERK